MRYGVDGVWSFGLEFSGQGFRDIFPIMENQLEKKMANETGDAIGISDLGLGRRFFEILVLQHSYA